MAGITFEGDIISQLTEIQQNFARNIFNELGYENKKIVVESVGKLGDNFSSNVIRFTTENEAGEKFSIVAKVAPASEFIRMTANSNMAFKNESVIFTKLFDSFEKLQRKFVVSEVNCFCYPKLYAAYIEPPNEILLLEDLKQLDYVMLEKSISLTDDTMKLVLKEIAALHSLSFVLRNKEPEEFNEIQSQLVDAFADDQKANAMSMFFMTYEQGVLPILDEKYKKYVNGLVGSFCLYASELGKFEKTSKYSVIQHGDAWTNNFMFKMEGNKPIKCVLIDYQQAKLSSPVADLCYLIFNCTDYDTRSKYFHDWINYYYQQLDRSLSLFGLKATEMYPREQIKEDFKRYGKYGLAAAILFTNIMLRQSTDMIDLKNEAVDMQKITEAMQSMSISMLPPDTVLRFKTKIEGLIDSFVEYGFI